MFYSAFYDSPVGKLFMTSDGINLTGLWIKKQKYPAGIDPRDVREKKTCRFLFKPPGGWINIFKNKTRQSANCLWLPKAENFVKRSGKSYAISRRDRFGLTAELPK